MLVVLTCISPIIGDVEQVGQLDGFFGEMFHKGRSTQNDVQKPGEQEDGRERPTSLVVGEMVSQGDLGTDACLG